LGVAGVRIVTVSPTAAERVGAAGGADEVSV
jgi:hypothetical protein